MTPAGVLYGQGHLDNDNAQYSGWVTQLLQRIARNFGRGMSPAGVWAAIIAAASRTAPGMPPIIGDYSARDALARICRRLDGSRDLVLALAEERRFPDIVMRVVERRLAPRDLVQLELMRKGLDGISPPRSWAAEPG
jgi:hypothetical protein